MARFEVRGLSMWPTLRPGQRVIASARSMKRRPLSRGDVVVVRHPTEGFPVVKRIVGMPGDAYDGRRLGDDEFALEGDNREASRGSEHFGPVSFDRFLARVRWAYWPLRRVR